MFTKKERTGKFRSIIKTGRRSGTDFRPVFEYVEKLREERKLKNLKGLLYFTDGDGIYPEKATDYETAFVFYKEKSMHQKVPAWAVKLYLDAEKS